MTPTDTTIPYLIVRILVPLLHVPSAIHLINVVSELKR